MFPGKRAIPKVWRSINSTAYNHRFYSLLRTRTQQCKHVWKNSLRLFVWRNPWWTCMAGQYINFVHLARTITDRDRKTLYPRQSNDESRGATMGSVCVSACKAVVRRFVTALSSKQNAVVFSCDDFLFLVLNSVTAKTGIISPVFSLIFMSALLRINEKKYGQQNRIVRIYVRLRPQRIQWDLALYYHNT